MSKQNIDYCGENFTFVDERSPTWWLRLYGLKSRDPDVIPCEFFKLTSNRKVLPREVDFWLSDWISFTRD